MAQQPRQTRAADKQNATRNLAQRPQTWSPASLLPDPEPVEGVKFRWIRKEILGKPDPTNYSRKMREGWEPCKLEDHPELELHVDEDAKSSGLVEVGGLILCNIPLELVEQRAEYYDRQTQAQMATVDNNMMREQDPRLPTLFKDHDSKVSFGNGS